MFIIFIEMKILVIAAMPAELKHIKEWIKSANIKSKMDIDYLCTWVWNYETIFSLENYLSRVDEKVFVLNMWLCWYWNNSNEKKHDLIQISSIINLYNKKELIAPPYLEITHMKTCISSEEAIFGKSNQLNFITNDELYFDMESWWIWFVCSKHKIPYLILKLPFDFIGNETSSLFNEKWNINKELINKSCESLRDLPYNNYLNRILNRIKQQEM